MEENGKYLKYDLDEKTQKLSSAEKIELARKCIANDMELFTNNYGDFCYLYDQVTVVSGHRINTIKLNEKTFINFFYEYIKDARQGTSCYPTCCREKFPKLVELDSALDINRAQRIFKIYRFLRVWNKIQPDIEETRQMTIPTPERLAKLQEEVERLEVIAAALASKELKKK